MPALANYEALKSVLVARFDTLSPQLQKIARFATDHPQEMAMNTVSALATELGVQPSAMVRFAKSLDFEGFSDMQQIYRAHLMQNYADYRERVATLGDVIPGIAAEGTAALTGTVRDGMTSLQHLLEDTTSERLQAAVELMARARQLFVLGQGRAFAVAYFASFALSRLQRRNLLLDGVGGRQTQGQLAELARPVDALLVVSFRPYTEFVVDTARQMGNRGVPVLALTDSPVSPLSSAADVALEVREDSEKMLRSLVAPVCLVQALMVSLGQYLAEHPGLVTGTAD